MRRQHCGLGKVGRFTAMAGRSLWCFLTYQVIRRTTTALSFPITCFYIIYKKRKILRTLVSLKNSVGIKLSWSEVHKYF